MGYRGYFSREAADGFADGLREAGLDVHVAGVPAYSTLGWFDDPLLNTFIHYPDYELARLIFHELAHQVVYVPGDSEFNESFAMAVESAGLELWLAQEGDVVMREAAAQAASRRAAVSALLQSVRSELAALYRLRIAPDSMRERKAESLADAQQRYRVLKAGWNGYAGYDALFAGLNNAQLAAFTLYHAWLPALQSVFERGNSDFNAFYAEARRLAALPKEAREAQLAAP
jgi:predicted aminopeptidase